MHASKTHILGFGAVVLTILLGSCALTLSHEGVVDFDKYRVLYVAEVASGSSWARDYLVGELNRVSGFDSVITDETLTYDAVLVISTEELEEVDISAEGIEYDYECTAYFELYDAAGDLMMTGSYSDDNDYDPSEALEDALDEVANHFLAPYRI